MMPKKAKTLPINWIDISVFAIKISILHVR